MIKMMMTKRKVKKNRLAAVAAVICSAMMLGSCSVSEIFNNLPGENATELYSHPETATVPPPETAPETELPPETVEAAAETQPEAAETEESSSEAEKKLVILNAPGNSLAAEYFLDGETDQTKDGYRKVYEGIYNYQSVIEVEHGVFTTEQMTDLINFVVETGLGLDTPESSYRMYVDGDNMVTKVEFTYSRSFEEGGQMYEQLMSKADEIVKEAQPLITEYDKVKYFHDTIINNCSYDTAAVNGHAAYGALCDGKASCEGYSKAFTLLCDRAGITALPVHGPSTDTGGNTEGHMWNKVLCDGEWYNIDVTWDDPSGNTDNLRYDYFLIDDTSCSRSHTAETNIYMNYPLATNAFGDYYTRNGLVIGYDSDIYDQLYFLTSSGLPEETAQGIIDFRCLDENLYTQIKQQYFTDAADGTKGFSDILKMFMQPGESLRYEFSDNPQTYTFRITVTRN